MKSGRSKMTNKKEEKRIFKVGANVDGISPLKDGGLSIRFHTQEVSNDEKVLLMSFYQQFGWLLFSEDTVKVDQIPEQNADIEGRKKKRPSQRLRSTLWVLGNKKGFNTPTEQDAFYERQMERFIDKVKSEIEILDNK